MEIEQNFHVEICRKEFWEENGVCMNHIEEQTGRFSGPLPGTPIIIDSFEHNYSHRVAFHVLTHFHAGLTQQFCTQR
jgi:hypothetical protein